MPRDSIKAQQLREIEVTGQKPTIERLAKERDTFIFAGKKTEVIQLENLNANITEKTPRQLFAKVPGVFVYDMDGSGNQVNIATRGLDPHRGWEFNIRKNGIITNSDMYGYPASHYSMPMEAVQRIEIVRGTGSLQYGAQFGGMLNYVSKQPDTTKAIGLESIAAAGSFGLLSTYNAISGTVGKFSYYAYYSRRTSDGYRDNSQTDYDAQGVILRYQPTKALRVSAEFARSNYIYQIPGPLTDSMFRANPRMATRGRNYFNPDIYVPSLTVDYLLSDNTQLQWTSSAVLGNRNSVQFDKPANVADRIDPLTLQYAPRQVDIDQFHSYTSELRLRHRYQLGALPATLVTGLQLMRNNLHRSQLGKGTTGTDFDLTLSQPGWGRDLNFITKNMAIFAENRLLLSSKFSLSPGIRLESGQSDMSGQITYYQAQQLPNTIKHRFPLLGINADYEWRAGHNFYAGFSQAYRPVIFKDIIPASTFERADKNLKDATGYNLEAGYRGQLAAFNWDVSLFQLRYNNRLGSLMQTDEAGDFYILRTNTGNSLTRGLEFFTEYQQQLAPDWHFSLFTSTCFMEARYLQAQVRQGNENVSIKGNQVEGVPQVISRNGMTIRHQPFSLSVLYSYTAKSYADPLNTEISPANGAVGLVPAYGILDVNAAYRISRQIQLKVNLNNVFNTHYFTKRPSFYPGPGIWPSDGRSVNAAIGIKI
ncbi:TonB-dependent receptor [Adhaeribacter aerolatus]|uniref:TonB-dependent receptor n=1 Tax=Adhaeribacter aerolatus TaxID=670289 RepID=A0A512B0G8_9BACT|nr:TonB-dependent receptor [Adhaeribacter aerolatus]